MMAEEKLEIIVKIVILGEASVGKTNLLLRFSQNRFEESMKPTIGMDFLSKEVEIDGCNCKIQFWDTAGQEKYRSLASTYYKVANGAILVYDVTRSETFAKLNGWLEDIKNNTSKDLKILLIANKTDLITERQVSVEEGRQFAQERSLFFWETSAKENSDKNVNKAFMSLIEECVKEPIEIEKKKQELDFAGIRKGTMTLRNLSPEPKNKEGCC